MEKMENKPELAFSELPVGRIFRPLEYVITKELVEEYMETVGDRHPLYLEEASIAPPGLAAIYYRLSYLQDHSMPSGGVLIKQEIEFHNPIRIGDNLLVEARVIESTLDNKQRKRVTLLIEARNQRGEPVSTVRFYGIWPK